MSTAPGWYNAQGDPPGTTRYWNGAEWVGDPVATPAGPTGAAGGPSATAQLGSAGARIGARVIDLIISAVIVVAFLFTKIQDLVDRFDRLGPDPTNAQVQQVFEDTILGGSAALLLGIAAGFAWEWLWVALAGGTPGKLMLGLRVTDATSNQTPPGIARAGLRAANRLLPLLAVGGTSSANAGSGIGLIIGLISLIMLFSDDRHRTVMDRIAGTIVTRK